MAILEGIVNKKDQEVVVKSLVTTQKEVSTILKFLVTKEKAEQKQKKVVAQREKREKADFAARERKKAKAAKKQNQKKEGKGGILDMLGGIGGILGGISGLVLLKALGIGAIGAAIVGYIASPEFRKFVNKNILGPLGSAIQYAFEEWMGPFLEKMGKMLLRQLGRPFGWQPESRTGITDDAVDAEQAKAKKENDKKKQEALKKINEMRADISAAERQLRSLEETAERYRERLKKLEGKNDPVSNFDRWMLERSLRMIEEGDGYGGKKQMEERITKSRATIDELIEEHGLEDLIQKRQSGGPILVPGSGSGDKVGAILQPGSFVLNRNAAGYQEGGVPTLLEPGEKVYGPGQWGMKEWLMNKMIPRFQEGGATGEGKAAAVKPEKGAGSMDYGLVNPTPNTSIATNKGGYAADTGLDIHGKIGDPIVASASGILEYLEKGHTRQQGQDSDPTKPGIQDQHSYRIKLDKPFEYNGKKVNFIYGTHLSSMNPEFANKSGVRVNAGDVLGGMGEANKVPHLHIGLVGDRAQSEFLNYKEVRDVLMGAKTTAGTGSTGSAGGGGGGGGAGGGGGNFLENFIQGISNIGGAIGQVASGILQAAVDVFGPGLGLLFGNMGNLIMGGGAPGSFEKATSGGNDGGGAAAGPNNVTTKDPNARALLKAISRAEGTTGSYGTMFGGAVNSDLAAGKLTVDQAIQLGMGNPGSGATGKYQFMPNTLRGLISNGTLKGSDMFTNELQDKAALSLVKGRGVNLSDGLSQAEVQKLSWEWASIKGNNYTYNGRPQGKVGQSEFMSWYENDGGKIQGKQSGGIVNMRSRGGGPDISAQSEQQFIDKLAAATTPIVIPVGGGGGQQAASSTVQGQNNAPELSVNPSNNVALDLAYRLSMGAAFS